jgi:glycosyltransferase involved in cell wall biosynthesis
MRIAVVTDAWRPQVNGVVRTLTQTGLELERDGHAVRHIGPDIFRSLPCPTYPEIRLAVLPRAKLERELDAFAPDTLHIATEGPLGMAARAICRDRGWRFTTSYHTQFPQYLRLRAPIPERWTYRWLRSFHGAGVRTLVPTPSVKQELEAQGFANVALWTRGVDTERFAPGPRDAFGDLPRPICLYVGRVAVEKNIDAFLAAPMPGSKVVVGDGPDLARLRREHPTVTFTGYRDNGALAACYRSADVFVFPSRTDTFGLVMLEAMASGVPVAAFPVTGPVDVVEDGVTGALDEDLGRAVERALKADAAACRAHAERNSWRTVARQFAEHLVPLRERAVSPAVSPMESGT